MHPVTRSSIVLCIAVFAALAERFGPLYFALHPQFVLAFGAAFAAIHPRFSLYVLSIVVPTMVLAIPGALFEGFILIILLLAAFLLARFLPSRGWFTTLLLIAFGIAGFALSISGISFFTLHLRTLLIEFILTGTMSLLFYSALRELFPERGMFHGAH